MLHEFLSDNRSEILARSRKKVAERESPTATKFEFTEGIPLFLDELTAILRTAKGQRGPGEQGVAAGAAVYGEDMLRSGMTVGQVVHDYGSICQSVTELAAQLGLAIGAEEFQTFNGCLDDAIANAVTSFERQRDRSGDAAGITNLGFLAHEMRNLLSISMRTFDALTRGTVGINGSTGTLHRRSLQRMSVLIDRTLADVKRSRSSRRSRQRTARSNSRSVQVPSTCSSMVITKSSLPPSRTSFRTR